MLRRHAPVALLLAAACATSAVPASFADEVLAAPGDGEPRLLLNGNSIVAATAPLPTRDLPRAVAVMLDAIAPDGQRTFTGREWGPRGEGYRIDCSYTDPPHVRSMLLTPDGRVLERSHTVPIADVPQHILATGLRTASLIDEAAIVSGPEREEYWTLMVRDRSGRRFAVRIDLAGHQLSSWRRLAARLDASADGAPPAPPRQSP
jgi:hypothetical protein